MKLCRFLDALFVFGGSGLDWKIGLGARGVFHVAFSGRLMLTEPGWKPPRGLLYAEGATGLKGSHGSLRFVAGVAAGAR